MSLAENKIKLTILLVKINVNNVNKQIKIPYFPTHVRTVF